MSSSLEYQPSLVPLHFTIRLQFHKDHPTATYKLFLMWEVYNIPCFVLLLGLHFFHHRSSPMKLRENLKYTAWNRNRQSDKEYPKIRRQGIIVDMVSNKVLSTRTTSFLTAIRRWEPSWRRGDLLRMHMKIKYRGNSFLMLSKHEWNLSPKPSFRWLP